MLESAFFSGLPSLPYKASLAKNPSYPKQAVPLVTMNPLSPLRGSAASIPSSSNPGRKLQLDIASPSDSVSEERLEDTARVLSPEPKAASPVISRPASAPISATASDMASATASGLSSGAVSPQEEQRPQRLVRSAIYANDNVLGDELLHFVNKSTASSSIREMRSCIDVMSKFRSKCNQCRCYWFLVMAAKHPAFVRQKDSIDMPAGFNSGPAFDPANL